jgi:RHS repeat-associated protein
MEGFQTSRTIGGVAYTLTYDRENRLTAIASTGAGASVVHDAEGNRVKSTVNGVTTIYIAGIYEQQGTATTLYYEGNGLRRTGYAADNGVFYRLTDHLGSSSTLVTQAAVVSGARNYYYPYGENRGGAAFNGLTAKRFTGQYHEAALPGGEGLSDYGARWYDARLGRFLSADTVVPGAMNPQALNRYSYVYNRPTGLTDPSGHEPIGCYNSINGVCTSQSNTSMRVKTLSSLLLEFGRAYQESGTVPDIFYTGFEIEAGYSGLLGGGAKGGAGIYWFWDFQNNMNYRVYSKWGEAAASDRLLTGLRSLPSDLRSFSRLWGASLTYVRGAGFYRANQASPFDGVDGPSIVLSSSAAFPVPLAGHNIPVGVSASLSTNYFNAAEGIEVLLAQSGGGLSTPGTSTAFGGILSEVDRLSVTSFSSNLEMAVNIATDRVLHGDSLAVPFVFYTAMANK